LYDWTDTLPGLALAHQGRGGTYTGAPTIYDLSALHDAPMAEYVTSLGIILLLLKQMETSVLRLRRLREYVTAEISAESLDAAIAEGELRIADVKRKLIPCVAKSQRDSASK